MMGRGDCSRMGVRTVLPRVHFRRVLGMRVRTVLPRVHFRRALGMGVRTVQPRVLLFLADRLLVLEVEGCRILGSLEGISVSCFS